MKCIDEKIIPIVIILAISGVVYLVTSVESERYDDMIQYMNEPKEIKEMTSVVGNEGEFHGSYILVSGSVYGRLDTSHIMTLIYSTRIDGITIHRYMSIPFDKIDFITVGNNTKPYIMISKYKTYIYKDKTGEIERIKLYLPEGWVLIKSS